MAASARPRPWAGLAALVAFLASVTWVPTGGLSGFIAPIGLAFVAAGWRSASRRWLLWLALVVNAYVLINSVLVIAAEASGAVIANPF